jgi:flavin reductase (DIM6/NTAB) family NADH-FMN oxidoreductase RutF
VIIGEIVLFHIADELYDQGHILLDKFKPVARLAGNEYTTLGRRFGLDRKPWPPKK